MEQIKQQAEVKKHQSDAVNRAQNALLMRQKLEKERAEAGEKESDNQGDEKNANGLEDESDDDLFGDENDEGLAGPQIVIPDAHQDGSGSSDEEYGDNHGKRSSSKNPLNKLILKDDVELLNRNVEDGD